MTATLLPMLALNLLLTMELVLAEPRITRTALEKARSSWPLPHQVVAHNWLTIAMIWALLVMLMVTLQLMTVKALAEQLALLV